MQRKQFLKSAATLLAGAALGLPQAALAQAAWPNKPVRFIVNFPAGGSPDIVARAVATPLAAALGVPVVVENRAGAGGIVGTDAVAKSVPDGYTFLVSSGSNMSIVPLISAKLPYNPEKDLVPVAAGARLELFLVVRADLPFNTYADFIKYAKANPGKLTYGTPGNGTSPHIAGEMLKSQAGIYSVHIPYKGSGAVLQDLLGGQLDYSFDPGIAFQHIKTGKLKLLAMGSAKRSPLYPNTPTLAELGLKGFDTGTTHGFWAPAGTPQAIVDRVNGEINKTLQLPAVADAIKALGAEPTAMSPAQFGVLTKNDLNRYAVIVKERKITSD